MKMDNKTVIHFFLFCILGIFSLYGEQFCSNRGKCVTESMTTSYRSYQFGGYTDGCGKANTTRGCANFNSRVCRSNANWPRLIAYDQGSGNTLPKKIICYGFEERVFGHKREGSKRPPWMVCRTYNDTPGPPPMLNATLKIQKFHEVNKGGSLTITCEAEHALSFKWELNGEEKSQGRTLKIEDASFEDQGTYFCHAIGRKYSDISAEQVIVVKGFLQFLVTITSDTDYNLPEGLIGNITNSLNASSFNVRERNDGVGRLDVYKFLETESPNTVYKELNDTLRNVSRGSFNWNYIITNTGFCPSGPINTDSGDLMFPAALVGTTADSYEISLTSNTEPRARCLCDGNYTTAARWGIPTITNVIQDAQQNITSTIKNLENNIADQPVGANNATYVSEVLTNVTKPNPELETEQVEIVVEVLLDVAMAGNASEKVTINIILTVNNLVETSESNETEVKLSSNASATILQSIEQQIENVRGSERNFSFSSASIDVYVVQVVGVDIIVIYRTYFFEFDDFDKRNISLGTEIFEEYKDPVGDGEDKNRLYENELDNPHSNQTDSNNEEETAMNATSIEVDRGAIGEMLGNNTNGNETFPISFLLHRRPTLFNAGHSENERINTFIVSASVDGVVKNLPDESNIITRFHPIERHRCAKPSCVYWDPSLNDGLGEWSTNGCYYVETEDADSQYTCRCNHLTNFAVLVDIKGDLDHEVLDILTVIGCIVSVWSIMVTIFSYLGIKKLRTSRPQQIVLNICFALLGLYLSFLTGIDQAHNHIPCVIFGALIHFFTLASVTWMSVEATNMYLLFVKVFNVQINHFMIKASLVGWGIPAIIVSVSAITSPDTYSNCKYCFPDSGSIIFYVCVLSVVALLLTYNLVIFVLVTRKLTCGRAKMTNRNVSRQETFRRLQNALAISVLLGVTWIFGLFSIGQARFIFNLLFCLTNSFQGFFIFLLFCLRQQEVRNAWMTWLRLSVSRVGPTTSTVSTGTGAASKGKTPSGEKSTSGVSSQSKMELSKVKNVSEVSVAEDACNVYAEVGEVNYDEVKATPNVKPGPKIYNGYTELDARHRVLPPLPEEAQYTKRINPGFGNTQAYMEIGETPALFHKRNGNQIMSEKRSNSTKSAASSQSGYGFVDYKIGTLPQDANVRPTSEFYQSSRLKKSKKTSKSKTRRGFSTKD